MFRYEKRRHRCRARIDGEMTIYNAAALKEKLTAILDDERELEIDLEQVCEIDSAGIQLLMLAHKERARHGRPLSLVRHSGAVLDAFELMGLAGYFNDPIVLTRTQGGTHGS